MRPHGKQPRPSPSADQVPLVANGTPLRGVITLSWYKRWRSQSPCTRISGVHAGGKSNSQSAPGPLALRAPTLGRIPPSPGPLALRAPTLGRMRAFPGPLALWAPTLGRIPPSPGPLALRAPTLGGGYRHPRDLWRRGRQRPGRIRSFPGPFRGRGVNPGGIPYWKLPNQSCQTNSPSGSRCMHWCGS